MIAARVALGLLLAAALVLVLGPLPVGGLDAWHRFLLQLALDVDAFPVLTRPQAEVLANVLLFLPLGFLVPLAVPRLTLLTVLLGLVLLSGLLELVQLVALVGRTPSGRDVAANTLGALLGIALAALVRERQVPGGQVPDGRRSGQPGR